jgi:hypothetical protein
MRSRAERLEKDTAAITTTLRAADGTWLAAYAITQPSRRNRSMPIWPAHPFLAAHSADGVDKGEEVALVKLAWTTIGGGVGHSQTSRSWALLGAPGALLSEAVDDPGGIERWPLTYAASWLTSVRCPSSVPVAFRALRAGLVAGRETHDLWELFAALETIAGLDVLALYDELIEDPAIPGAGFLYYQRDRAVKSLVEQAALAAITDDSLRTAILDNVPVDQEPALDCPV